MVQRQRAGGETASTSWRPRWANPAASRPVARWSSSSSISSSVEARPERVDRHPHLAAEAGGEREARGAGPRAQSAARTAARAATSPVRRRDRARRRPAWRSRSPRRPAPRMRRPRGRPSLSASGRSDPARSASQGAAGPGGAARSPAVSASPFPSRSSRSDHARRPPRRARPSRSRRAAVDDDHLGVGQVAPERRRPSRRSALLVPRRDEDGEALKLGELSPSVDSGSIGGTTPSVRRLLDAVVPRLAAGEEEREREPAGGRSMSSTLEMPRAAVDRRSTAAGSSAVATPTTGSPVPLEPADEALQSTTPSPASPVGLSSLSLRAAPRSARRPPRRSARGRAGLLLDQLRLRARSRCVSSPSTSSWPSVTPSVGKSPCRPRTPRGPRRPRAWPSSSARVDRHVEGDDARRSPRRPRRRAFPRRRRARSPSTGPRKTTATFLPSSRSSMSAG